jgi:hypothetical protein
VAEHFLGKEEVWGSIPHNGSYYMKMRMKMRMKNAEASKQQVKGVDPVVENIPTSVNFG